jgi:hypothetical protein
MCPCQVCGKEFKDKRAQHYHETRVHKFHNGLCNKCDRALEYPKRRSKRCNECNRKLAYGYYRRDFLLDPELVRRTINAKAKKRTRDIRIEMIAAYGGECVCCGEQALEFLSIDHIYGDGRQDREKLNVVGHTFYRILKRQGWPKDRYRLLCFNCNFAIGHFGYCPHQIQLELFSGGRCGSWRQKPLP